jgi:hypothetical protein
MLLAQFGGSRNELFGDLTVATLEVPPGLTFVERGLCRCVEFVSDEVKVLPHPGDRRSGQGHTGRKVGDVDDLEVSLAATNQLGRCVQPCRGSSIIWKPTNW